MKVLRYGWYCPNLPISFLQVLNFSSTPLIFTGIVLLVIGLGHAGAPRGGSEEPGNADFAMGGGGGGEGGGGGYIPALCFFP